MSEEQRINQKEIVRRFNKISKTLFRTEKIFEDPKKGLELWNTKCFGGSADANEKEKKGKRSYQSTRISDYFYAWEQINERVSQLQRKHTSKESKYNILLIRSECDTSKSFLQ